MQIKDKDFYEMAHKGLHKTVLNVFTKLKKPHNVKILDIGCGNGNMLREIQALGYYNLYGCDGFTKNEKLLNMIKFEQTNLNEPLPYEENTFDVILLTEVIEHMEYPNLLFKEIHKILKADGVVIVSTPNILSMPSRILYLLTGHFLLFMESDIKYDKFPGHIAPFLRYIFKRVFKKHFKIESMNYSNRIVPLVGIEIGIKHRLLSNSIILTLKKI